MIIDLMIHAGTKLALWQWLELRELGTVTQDTDPFSPTFGQWFYHHTNRNSGLIWWRHPSGKLESTFDYLDPENISITYFNGFYGILRYEQIAFESELAPWLRNNTAISILDSFNGIGGQGITLVDHSDVQEHLDAIGMPGHEWQGSGIYSNPSFWFLSPIMVNDEREFGGQTYRSLIDFNVWTPDQYPEGWELV